MCNLSRQHIVKLVAPSSGHGDPSVLHIMFPSSVSNKILYTSCFPQDVDKYTGYEKILVSSGFGQLCKNTGHL